MSIYFLDTSAFAKRYISETGSLWVRSLTAKGSGHSLVVSELGTVEFDSVVARLRREKIISEARFRLVRSLFLTHLRTQYKIIKSDTRVYQTARTLLPKHPIRTLDAIQLASAIVAQQIGHKSIIFVSADSRLLNIAQAEGFSIDNPNNYP